MNSHQDSKYKDVTCLLHEGQEPGKWKCKAVVPPIVNSTTFAQERPGEAIYEYSRSGNPTRECLETSLATCEGAKYGLAFASGLGASTAICFLLRSGDHVLATSDLYGGTNRLFTKCMKRMNIDISYIADSENRDDPIEQIRTVKRDNTRMMWLETPTNPLMNVVGIEAVAQYCRQEGILLVVDNTFATPVFQKPLAYGADIVLHSATKYLNGHSDVVMGCLMLNGDDLYKELKFLQNSLGIVPSPMDCFLVNRGLKTLHVRMRQHMENAIAVSEFLESYSDCVERVYFPLSPAFPGRDIVKRQMSGCGGMISFILKAESPDDVSEFVSALKLFTLAESLGGYESLVCVPALMTHLSVDPEHRKLIGLSDNLIRLSVGLEDAGDLCADLKHAMGHMLKSRMSKLRI